MTMKISKYNWDTFGPQTLLKKGAKKQAVTRDEVMKKTAKSLEKIRKSRRKKR